MVNGFGEAMSEAQKAKVGGPKGLQLGWRSWGAAANPIPTSYGAWERCKLPQRSPGRQRGFPAFGTLRMTFQDSKTLDDLEWPICTLLQKDASFGAHHKNLNEHRPILSATKM